MDRHVLAGHGSEAAFIGVDRAALEAAVAGADLSDVCTHLSRRGLLISSVIAAQVLPRRGR